MPIPVLKTRRLTFRGFEADDLDRLAEILAKPDVMRYMPGGKPLSREKAKKNLDYILGQWDRDGYGWWAVIHNHDDTLIGWCGLGLVNELDEPEVAYLLDAPYWGRGIATEGAAASLRFGFEELELDRIIALAHTDNVGSQRVMQKSGMVYEKNLHLWGLDLVYYAITRDAFRPDDARYRLFEGRP
jgi:ribosomal-protein-alanine N-acetyltransferase